MYINGKNECNPYFGNNQIEVVEAFGKKRVIKKTFRFDDCFQRSVYFFKHIKSKHIPEFYGFDDKTKTIYREYIEGKDLGINKTPYALLLGDLSLDSYKEIWGSYKDFLKQIHDQNFLVYDIWMNNILFNGDDFYLIDFELTRMSDRYFDKEMALAESCYGCVEDALNIKHYNHDKAEIKRRVDKHKTFLTYVPYPYPCSSNAIYNANMLDCPKTICSGRCPFDDLSPTFNYPVGAKCWLQWPSRCADFFELNYDVDFNFSGLFYENNGRLFNFFVKHLQEQLLNEQFRSCFQHDNLKFIEELVNWASVVIRHDSKFYTLS